MIEVVEGKVKGARGKLGFEMNTENTEGERKGHGGNLGLKSECSTGIT
jgi:hypothetical protein